MKKKISRFSLHAKQREAWRHLFKEPTREVALISGVQGGKTIFGAFAMRKMLDMHPEPYNNFLVGAPTYKILEQATLPTFEKIHTKLLGHYNGKDGVFHLKDGRNVWFRTGTDPDSVEGVPDCVFAWMDEAGKCPRKFWVNFQGRVARRQGKILYTTTWYALNWLFKEVWRPWERGIRDDLHVVSFNSAENPTFPVEELERQKRILSPGEYQRKFLGEPGKVEGIVFDGWSEQSYTEPFSVKGLPIYGGIDWGFDHPTAITLRAFKDGKSFTFSLFKKSRLSVEQVLDTIERKAKMFNVKMFYCGHDRPDMIEELNKRGVRCMSYMAAAPKYREVNPGNAKLSEFMKQKRYMVFRGIDQAEDLEDEYLTYSWREYNEGTEGKEKPIGVNDDLIAAERYATVGTLHMMEEEEKLYNPGLRNLHRIDTINYQEDEKKDWSEY